MLTVVIVLELVDIVDVSVAVSEEVVPEFVVPIVDVEVENSPVIVSCDTPLVIVAVVELICVDAIVTSIV